MKHFIIPAIVALCCSFIVLNEKTYFAFNIYLSNQTGGAKAPLERITATLQVSKGAKTATSVYDIQGSKSTVRIKAIEAIFRTISDNMTAKTDPSTVIQLYQLDISKNKRSFSLTPDSKIQSTSVPISFQQDDYLNFKIILSGYLLPGEYAFVDKTTAKADGSVSVFAFGID